MLRTLFKISSIIIYVNCFSQVQDSIQTDTTFIVNVNTNLDTVSTVVDSVEQQVLDKPLFQSPFSEQSFFINKTNILRNDYRYTGDLLKHFPFCIVRSYGFIGQPNDIYLFGERSGKTNFFTDGVAISSSLFYSLDLNHIQSEDIDSIEIVPLSRGFMYGFDARPVSVNFITKDIIPTKPYSRVKYYEGPFGEAFIDGIFSMKLFNDLITSVDITNRKVDDSFKNSAFSIWQAKTKLRYNLSDHINIIGNYYFSKSNTGINGGVNINEIKQSTTNINSILYNEIRAPVYYENNSLNFKQHHLGLKILAKPFENAHTDLNFYYKFSLEEYNQIFTGYNSKTSEKNKIYGILLDQRVRSNNINFGLLSGYQIQKYNPSFFSSDPFNPIYSLIEPPTENKSIFFSPQIKMFFMENALNLFFYGKIAKRTIINTISEVKTNQSFGGFGADASINITDQLSIYAGYSKVDDITNHTNVSIFEASMSFLGVNHNAVLTAFNKKMKSTNTSGLALVGYYKYWRILIEVRAAQYFYNQGNTTEFFNMPKSNFNFGVYLKDNFFNSNLDLKAGLLTHYTGKQNLNSLIIPYKGLESDDVPSAFTIDFTLSGEIQKSAIVYFTWENLLDKEYYLTPYYPMLERNIRFGVAWEILN